MEGLTEGRMVHYVCPGTGAHRAAVVVNVSDRQNAVCDLLVFSMPQDGLGGLFIRTGAALDANGAEGTWHWIERV